MMWRRLRFPPMVALFAAAFLAANAPQSAAAEQENNAGPPRQLEIGVVNSDEMADAVMTVRASESRPTIGIGPADHAMITSILTSTRELVEAAALLVQDTRTLKEGQGMMEQASAKLVEVKEHISKINRFLRQQVDEEEERQLLRNKYSEHDVRKTQEDDARSLDVSRNIYETITSFPECVERWFDDCVNIINADLENLGLATIEMVVNEKRSVDQANYNKVVIVADEAAGKVLGRAGDGIVTYPYPWKDSVLGDRTVGEEGKWSCSNVAPVDCCSTIKESVPNPDINGNFIECHIFVPFGGVGNRRRDDRVFVNLSSDGRVHEAPYIS